VCECVLHKQQHMILRWDCFIYRHARVCVSVVCIGTHSHKRHTHHTQISHITHMRTHKCTHTHDTHSQAQPNSVCVCGVYRHTHTLTQGTLTIIHTLNAMHTNSVTVLSAASKSSPKRPVHYAHTHKPTAHTYTHLCWGSFRFHEPHLHKAHALLDSSWYSSRTPPYSSTTKQCILVSNTGLPAAYVRKWLRPAIPPRSPLCRGTATVCFNTLD
jgi:hypothetical protein